MGAAAHPWVAAEIGRTRDPRGSARKRREGRRRRRCPTVRGEGYGPPEQNDPRGCRRPGDPMRGGREEQWRKDRGAQWEGEPANGCAPHRARPQEQNRDEAEAQRGDAAGAGEESPRVRRGRPEVRQPSPPPQRGRVAPILDVWGRRVRAANEGWHWQDQVAQVWRPGQADQWGSGLQEESTVAGQLGRRRSSAQEGLGARVVWVEGSVSGAGRRARRALHPQGRARRVRVPVLERRLRDGRKRRLPRRSDGRPRVREGPPRMCPHRRLGPRPKTCRGQPAPRLSEHRPGADVPSESRGVSGGALGARGHRAVVACHRVDRRAPRRPPGSTRTDDRGCAKGGRGRGGCGTPSSWATGP